MAFQITDLTCNHMKNPIGMDDVPYFSYKLVDNGSDEKLTAYQIIVDDGTMIMWNSGRVPKDKQLLIKYDGKSLKPQTRYFWRVLAWNNHGECSESQQAYFETGLMQPFQWEAKWITADPQGIMVGNKTGSHTTAPYMRREFSVSKPVFDATLYVSGLGYYECYINGKSVKDTVLDPAFTEYDKAVMYRTHKVTNIVQGNNAISVVLGDGFYNADTDDVWNFVNAAWRDHSKCILILSIKYEDGTREEIVSDQSFKGTKGPILANDVRSLDRYDARLELGDWTMPNYDDSEWKAVAITRAPGGELIGQYTTPIRVVDEYLPKKIQKISDTTWMVDVGFNTTGWAEISMTAVKGTTVMLRYSEDFDENLEHMRGIYNCLKKSEKDHFQTDYYTAKGCGIEKWHPIFKYHGFRYILVKCETGIPADFTVKIQEVRTDLEKAGDFTCSDDRINQIQEITCRATRTNFHNMPTDCPHREKNGWTGDAQLSAEQLLYNFNGAAAYNRWMDDVVRAQRKTGQLPGIIPSAGWGFNGCNGPAWDSVCAVIPYQMYLYCGDTRVLQKMYPCLKKYIAFCETMATDNICEFGLGDWCAPYDSWHKQCEVAVTDTGYYYHDVLIASKIAAVLGFAKEAACYAEKAAEIRDCFRNHFIKRADTELELNCTKCQTSLGCMLYFGLVNEEEKQLFVDELMKEIHAMGDHFDVGILGAKYVCNALIESGEAELMLKAATNPTYPSWAYMVSQGATTLWEDWEGRNSQNHHMYGDISACFYKGITGIFADESQPGFKNTIFKPQFVSMLEHASAEHLSPYGKVQSSWKRNDDKIRIELTVPTNCTGELVLPKGMKLASTGESRAVFQAGTHVFLVCQQ
ncbi:MAG: family 78 glycoside hydrolase catalytic domain [Clostridiales bacterium]|nr:family 78 glycoside hydrolase catalytic domain [Clostridiales bacterium]